MNQARNQGGEAPPRKFFALAGKFCWIYFETIGHSSKILGPSQKTLRPSWCPNWLRACNELLKKFRF